MIDPKGTAPGLVEEVRQPTVAIRCPVPGCGSSLSYDLTRVDPQESRSPARRHYKCVDCHHVWGVDTGGYFPYLASLLVCPSLAFVAREPGWFSRSTSLFTASRPIVRGLCVSVYTYLPRWGCEIAMAEEAEGIMRCAACRGRLGSSGREVYRYVCGTCGQHYFLEMRLVPVPAEALSLPSGEGDAR